MITNGTVVYFGTTIPRPEGSTINYFCNTGYKLNGTSNRECANTGWTGSAPICIGIYTYFHKYLNAIDLLYRFTATCDDLTLPNGAVIYNPSTTSKLEGTVASFSCNTGYTLSSTATRTCQSDRQWSGSTPVCSCKW